MHVVMFCYVVALVHVGHSEYSVREGLIFQTVANVQIKKFDFQIVLQLDVTPIITEYSSLESQLRHLDLKVQEIDGLSGGKSNHIKGLMSFLWQNVKQYQREIANFQSVLPRSISRVTRGVCDTCGSGLNWAFGTMDNKDREKITQSLSTLESKQADDEFIMGKTILLQKGLEKNVLENTQRIKNITLKFVAKWENYTELMKKFQTQQAREIEKIEVEAIFSSMAIELSQAISSARVELIKFWDAIEMSIRHKLSPNLITPQKFLAMLNKVQATLQSPDKMIVPVDTYSISTYYELANIASFAQDSIMHVVITIPISSHGSDYKKIYVTPFPMYWPQVDNFVLWKAQKYVLLNADSSDYYMPTDILTCMGTKVTTVCETDNLKLHRSVNSCEVNVLLKNDTSFCHKQIVLSHAPYFKRLDKDILYSVQSKHQVSIVC